MKKADDISYMGGWIHLSQALTELENQFKLKEIDQDISFKQIQLMEARLEEFLAGLMEIHKLFCPQDSSKLDELIDGFKNKYGEGK